MNRLHTTLCLVLLVLPQMAMSGEHETLDSNTAFFDGISQSYTIRAPHGFWMETYDAGYDGYSLAFVPDGESFEMASTMIALTLYRSDKVMLAEIMKSDSAAVTEQFGAGVASWEVDSVRNFNGETLVTRFFTDKTAFLPVIMMSYYDGGTETLVFELHITKSGLPRFLAESVFTDCVLGFKVLPKKELPLGD